MLHRIKWEEDMVKDADGKESPNNCVLVWQVRLNDTFLFITEVYKQKTDVKIYFFSFLT